MNASDRAVLAKRVSQFVNDEHDSIFIIPLCDLFHISDDLRSWLIEDRDKKAEMVYEENDPGVVECERRCMYEAVWRA